jgi:hypothetical protein
MKSNNFPHCCDEGTIESVCYMKESLLLIQRAEAL